MPLLVVDLPPELVGALDRLVAEEVVAYKESKKPRPLTHKEKAQAVRIAEKDGQRAANDYLRSIQNPSSAAGPGRPRDFPSRRLLVQRLLTEGLARIAQKEA